MAQFRLPILSVRNLGLLFLCGLIPAKLWAGPIKSEGYLDAAADYDTRKNRGKVEITGDLKFESKRWEGIRGEFDITGDTSDREVTVEQAFLDYKNNNWRFDFGLIKKRLGLEYEKNHLERLWPKHSLIYKKLKERALVGYENQLRSIWTGDSGLKWESSIGAPTSKDLTLRSTLFDEGEASWNNYGFSLLAQNDLWDRERRAWIYTAIASLYSSQQTFNYEAELVHGTDPIASEWASLGGDLRYIYFGGARLLLRYALPFAPHWELLNQSSVYSRNSDDGRQTEHELGVGFSLKQEHYRWKNAVQWQNNAFSLGADKVQSASNLEVVSEVQVPF